MAEPAALRDRIVEAGCVVARPLARLTSRASRPAKVSRAVIVKPASLGDVLMTTPTLRALRKMLPDAHLAFAVGSWSMAMVAGNPCLDRTVHLGGVGEGRLSVHAACRAVGTLRAGKYDIALVLDRSPLVGLLPLLAGIPWRVGLDSRGRGFAHSTCVPCTPDRHETQLYLDVARACGCADEQPRMQFFPSPEDDAAAAVLLDQRAVPSERTGPLVGIHPAGGINPGMTLLSKRWPAERFALLADRLIAELDATVILLGGPGDTEVTAAVSRAMSHRAVDLCGKLNWGQLGALLKRCSLLVANDTCAAHLAMAVGTRCAMIFGPTSPAQYGPAVPQLGEAVSLNLACSPCFRHGRAQPCRNEQRCLRHLEVTAVWEAALRLLEAGTRQLASRIGHRKRDCQ